MASTYKTPGVYVEEIRKFPPSVAQVETAIPAFIGYTQMAKHKIANDLDMTPHRITSMLEYENHFGSAENEANITVTIDEDSSGRRPTTVNATTGDTSPHIMFYAMQAFFANGGGPCYIVSVGRTTAGIIDAAKLTAGLNTLEKIDEVTLIVFPESQSLGSIADFKSVQDASLAQCAKLQDRFAVMDVNVDQSESIKNNIDAFRNDGVGTDNLKYGAAYYPNVETIFDYSFDPTQVTVVHLIDDAPTGGLAGPMADLEEGNNAMYARARAAVQQIPCVLPPSSLVVGIYADVDNKRGVWKAPANVSLKSVIGPVLKISDEEQRDINVDVQAGKSVNAIRTFVGKGTLVWGARTLAGNDNEWRYVSVRRFFNMVEESVKKASSQFVFEPNDANTWVMVKAMIENFLTLQWRAGALAGAVPEHAFYVKIGLNETMTAVDILEGRMIVEIGMAAVRPAEFIILKFSHKMQES